MNAPSGLRGTLMGMGSGLLTSPALRTLSRRTHAAARRIRRGPMIIHYFHGVADPWSHLAVQLLPALADRYDVTLVPHLVGPPADAVAPDRSRLIDWSIRDAAQLAAAHGLAWPVAAVRPDDAAVRAVEQALASIADSRLFATTATRLGQQLWSGQAIAEAGAHPAARLAEGNAALAAAGHYLPAVFAFEGECYWGVDRLPHLEARLAGESPREPLVRQLEASDRPGHAPGARLHFFLSLRSPYTCIAAARVRRLADQFGAVLVLRPVLPMVMRGLPVPREKRLYIVRDTMREAERLGLTFGRICDPVGAGVERGMAVLHRAIAMGHGPEFAESFLAGAFAEAVDATTDAGLLHLAERAGLTAADVKEALADDGWRAIAEANRDELLAHGLWGVPSFRVVGVDADRAGGRHFPPHWGQDRLWAVERDLRQAAGEAQP